MKKKLSGDGSQTKGLVAPGVLLTLSILKLNSVPDPFSGVASSERAEMRRVLSVPGPVLRMFEETFQLPPVSPAFLPLSRGREPQPPGQKREGPRHPNNSYSGL